MNQSTTRSIFSIAVPLAFTSFKAKIVSIFITAVVLESIIGYFLLFYASNESITHIVKHEASIYAQLMRSTVSHHIANDNEQALNDSLLLAVSSSDTTHAFILGCDGSLAYSSDPSRRGMALTEAFTEAPMDIYAAVLAANNTQVISANYNSPIYFSFAPTPCKSVGTGEIYPKGGMLILRTDFSDFIEFEKGFYFRLSIGQLFVSVLVLLGGVLIFYNQFARKLGAISQSMDKFSADQPNQRYEAQGSDELDNIGVAFNKMADTIQKQFIRIQNTNKRLLLTDKVFELTSVGVVILSKDLIILDVNPAFVEINGYELHEVVGKPFDFLCHEIPEHDRLSAIDEANSKGSAFREHWVRCASGRRFRKAIKLSPMHDSANNITHYFVIERDVTEDYMQKLQLQTLATTDSLTGLKNRRQFEIDAEKLELTESGCYAVASIDLDGLKEINTKYGHLAGDRFIEEAGRRLDEQVENIAIGVYRLGGDEFCVILNHPGDINELTRLCRAIMAAVEGSLKIELITADLTIGLGVSIFDSTRHKSTQDVIKEADIALKEAKLSGRSSFLIATEQVLRAHERKTNISLALKSPKLQEQLQVAYLPKVDIQNDILSGAEALIRWTSPDLGFICNDEFIPIAEDTGDILKIDEWVMRRAISHSALFCEALDGFQTTINVSPRQLFESYFADELVQQLERNQVDSENFSVEITEWTAIQHYERFVPVLDSLRSAGLAVELDDFGTGHSSLVNLHKLPVDALKIDRSFVDNMVENRVSMEIVRSIILLAHSLKMTVIAEGVESVTQLELLREMGCDYCQGYLYSEPVIVENEDSLKRAIQQWQETIASLQ